MSKEIKTNIWIGTGTIGHSKRVFSGYLSALPSSDTVLFISPGICGYQIRNVYMMVYNNTVEISLVGHDNEELLPEVKDIFDRKELEG